MSGTQRLKVAECQIKECDNVLSIISKALIDKGYDIDVEPINDNFSGANGSKINIYKRIV